MERPTALSGMVSQVTYNAANQMTGGSFPACCGESVAETRTYNSLHQLTRIQQSYLGTYCAPNCTWLDMTYNYTGGQNNGQIASSVDGMSGERSRTSMTPCSGWFRRPATRTGRRRTATTGLGT